MTTATSSHPRLAATAVAAMGVVYGDIGTSPLYTMKEVFHGPHAVAITPGNVLGILSLVFWAMTITVSLMYVVFIMRADNHGEGGIMALTSLAQRTSALPPRLLWLLTALGIFGAALFYGDAVITPAMSVLSAVEGLEVAAPSLHPWVVPISIGILAGLFLIQRKGTASVGALFGPIMLFWFGTLGVLGLIQVIDHPAVLAAFDPRHAAAFFVENRLHGFLALGAVVLAITGGEALYADMGHFGRKPIAVAWISYVFPLLYLNYLGQGALILGDPETAHNPFYRLVPESLLYPMIALATAATVIASQAVISGAFSLTTQAMQLGYCPRIRVHFTSAREKGQIYVPNINWLLLLAVLFLVLEFRSSSALASAYGIAVTLTMMIDTILAFVVVRTLWNWPWAKAIARTRRILTWDFSLTEGENAIYPHYRFARLFARRKEERAAAPYSGGICFTMTPMLNQLSLFEAAQSFLDRDANPDRLAGNFFARIFGEAGRAFVEDYRLFEVIPDWGSYDVVKLPRADYHRRMTAFVGKLEDAKGAVRSGAVLFPDPEKYRQELVFFARLFADLTAPHPDYDALKKTYWDHVYRIYDVLPDHVDPRPRGNTERFVKHFQDWA